MGLCSVSTVSQSQPWAARLSATIGSPIVTQTPTAGLPSLSLRFTGLGVIATLPGKSLRTIAGNRGDRAPSGSSARV